MPAAGWRRKLERCGCSFTVMDCDRFVLIIEHGLWPPSNPTGPSPLEGNLERKVPENVCRPGPNPDPVSASERPVPNPARQVHQKSTDNLRRTPHRAVLCIPSWLVRPAGFQPRSGSFRSAGFDGLRPSRFTLRAAADRLRHIRGPYRPAPSHRQLRDACAVTLWHPPLTKSRPPAQLVKWLAR